MSYPPQPGYGAPGGYPPPGGYAPQPQPSNGLAVGALVTGLISLLCFPGLAVVAIPLAIAGMSRAKKLNGVGRGMAIGGLVSAIIGVLWGIAVLVLVVFAADKIDDIDFRCGGDGTSPAGYPCENQGNDDPTPGDDSFNSDPADQICNVDRFIQDPDC
ncbi:MAG TPA: DUF4190 domain-containing protein [Iamia sp.]|jgi:hypothetical protein|nr:DUF4190 domain-containing protein [Iamia sp.]